MLPNYPTLRGVSRIISKEEAGEIALTEAMRTMGSAESKGERVEIYRVTDQRPTGAYMSDQDPAWFVYVPWFDGFSGLQASRVIAVSKIDGRVLYDGSAGDEG